VNPVISLEVPELSVENKIKHQHAAHFFGQKRLVEASRILTEILAAQETGELWNDWSTTKFALGQITEAEHGFRRALELSPSDRQISENLGALLFGRHQLNEAILLLKNSMIGESDARTSPAALLLTKCHQRLSEWLIEFRKAVTDPSTSLDQIPRWPLDRMALHLAKQSDFETAMKLLNFNLHFSPEHLGMIKMRECIKMLHLEKRSPDGSNSGRQLAALTV